MDLFALADKLFNYLSSRGICFTEDGYPIFPEDILLQDIPQEVIPVRQRYAVKEKGTTVLCLFDRDEYLYRRLLHLEDDIGLYRQYMGVGGFDLSPRVGWNITRQRFNILLNQMAAVYLGLQGIKILPNFRTGDIRTFKSLNAYPPGQIFLVGSLGCARGYLHLNEMYLRTKCMITRPKMLLYYGVLRREYRAILEEIGTPYQIYEDFRKRSYRSSQESEHKNEAYHGGTRDV